jgi:hypothetical protein
LFYMLSIPFARLKWDSKNTNRKILKCFSSRFHNIPSRFRHACSVFSVNTKTVRIKLKYGTERNEILLSVCIPSCFYKKEWLSCYWRMKKSLTQLLFHSIYIVRCPKHTRKICIMLAFICMCI